MSDKKLTIFQRLGQVIGPDSAKLKNVYNQPQRFNINKELLKTTDKREYELAKLQAQQNKYLGQMWKKVENGLYQQSINYETTRIGSYADFEAMEFYPIIAAALDIIMEEATTVNDKGKVLNVYSESNRVKTILQDLFFNRLDIHTSLPMWTRNTPIRENSVIPLLDGTEITIKELSNRVKNGEEVWSYAIQDVTKAIVPSKIVWCDLTRRNSELYRVTLDDGTYIDTTPDHEYMLRDGSFKRADELTEGQSLMPFYTKTSVENYGKLNGYEKIYNPSSDKYEYTHRIIAKNCLIDSEKEKISGEKWLTHHINFKKRDNNPNNLKRMSFNEHSNLHEKLSKNLNEYRKKPEVIKKRLEGIDKYLRSDKRKKRLSEEMSGVYPKFFELYNNSDLHTEHNEIRSNKMLVNWSNKDFIKKTKKGMTIEISHACLNYISNIIINNQNYIGINKLAKLLKTDQEFINLLKETYTLRKDITKSINTTTLNKLIFRKTNKNYFEFVFSIKPEIILDKEYLKCKAIFEGKTKTKVINHKVISVIKLNETADVYCLEAVGPNGEHDRHNFPVCGFDSNSSYSRTSGVFLSNCKYGDNFVFLNVNDKHGIIGAKQMPNYEMERRESGLFDMISGSHSVNNNVPNSDKVKFYWRGRDVEFNSWQMAHFRLLGDDRRLPYGTSILEKARRIFKQLILAEDSMLVYRVTRAPERRVYKIYVGNIDDADVPAYVNEIADRFKRTPIIDSQTGQMDLRFNQLSNDQDFFIPVRSEDAPNPIDTLPGACISLNTKIPLLDGRTLELEKIIEEWNNGNRDLWVYSCDPKTGALAPGMITWAGLTRKDADVIRITLDNGESITTTPDHKWVHRTKGFVEAKDLIIGDSLMPFYRDFKKIKTKTNGDYERVWDSYKQEWVYTHRMVTDTLNNTNLIKEFVFDKKYIDEVKVVRHHKDHNRFNNNPSNLVWMFGADHMKYHQNVIMNTMWSNPSENIKKITSGINNYISKLTKEEKEIRGNQSRLNSINSRNKANKTFNNNPNKKQILIDRGKSISNTKSKIEFKEKFSKIAKDNWKSETYRKKVFNKKQKLIFTDEVYNMFFEMFKIKGRADLTLIELNKSEEFINSFKESNKEIRSSLTNLNEFTHNHLEKMLRAKGFKNFREWKKTNDLLYNHKIISIEWLETKMDTGTITVDGNELYHNYHTFATESGVFIKNSNLDQIADIEYLRNNLFTALRIPKPFLGFDETSGEGKNLALQDIRFSRTVNRVQQSMIQELNKIAIIHLYLLGFEDDLDNFSLTLNNPSTQAEMLKIEHLQQKITLLKDAVSDIGNGFGTMSWTRAHREILGWSNDEIKKDLLEQRMEKAASGEIANTANVIKHTGMFDDVDKIYGDYEAALKGGGEAAASTESAAPSFGGVGGGGGLGGGLGDLGGETTTPEGGETPELGGELGGTTPEAPAGGETAAPEAPAGGETSTPEETLTESLTLITENKKLLTDKLATRTNKYKNRFVNLIESIDGLDINKNIDTTKITDKNIKVNDDINQIINEIDKMLDE